MLLDRDGTIRLFIRICRDSRFGLEMHRAAALAGDILKTSALVVWVDSGLTIDDMTKLANGTSRYLRENGGAY